VVILLLVMCAMCDNGITLVQTVLGAYSCGVCMSSVTSCVDGGLFICFTCLHVPYSTVTLVTMAWYGVTSKLKSAYVQLHLHPM
jgi:hypothetical protein